MSRPATASLPRREDRAAGATFGDKGRVDLKLNMDQQIQPDLITGEIGLQSAPVVAATPSSSVRRFVKA